jgi:CRISPR type III-B/RAMP module RAMP protein Cmr1
MRYWYRALIGGIIGAENTTLSQVKKIEADLFGTTDTASIVRVKLSDASEKPRRYQKEGLLKVEEEGQSKEKPSGKDYLLWSMAESGIGKPTHKPDRYFFPGNTKFNVTLSSRGDDDTNSSRQ